jgi:hypothetical protein
VKHAKCKLSLAVCAIVYCAVSVAIAYDPFTTARLRATKAIATSATVTSSSTLTDGLIAYWPLNEASGSTVAYDSTANGRNLTVSGATFVGGKVGNCGYSSGSPNYMYYTNNAPFNPRTNNWSISFWQKNTMTGVYPYFVATTPEQSPYNGFLIRQYPTGDTINFNPNAYGVAPENGQYIFGQANDGNWHMMTATISTDTGVTVLRRYVDGTNTYTSTLAVKLDIGGQAGYFTLFRRYLQNSWFLTGYIDEVAIWNRTITTNEISELYNGGNGKAIQ